MLQGPLPCSLSKELKTKLFVTPAPEEPTNAKAQLRDGFQNWVLLRYNPIVENI